jgi:predicted  nucleic acid-binding Zn-ribbon protein
MNTEKRIQERLNKSKLIRKEKLGAIEDAINEAKKNYSEIGEELMDMFREMSSLEDNFRRYCSDAYETVINERDEIADKFERVYSLYYEIGDELNALGIDVDSPDILRDEFGDYYDQITDLKDTIK